MRGSAWGWLQGRFWIQQSLELPRALGCLPCLSWESSTGMRHPFPAHPCSARAAHVGCSTNSSCPCTVLEMAESTSPLCAVREGVPRAHLEGREEEKKGSIGEAGLLETKKILLSCFSQIFWILYPFARVYRVQSVQSSKETITRHLSSRAYVLWRENRRKLKCFCVYYSKISVHHRMKVWWQLLDWSTLARTGGGCDWRGVGTSCDTCGSCSTNTFQAPVTSRIWSRSNVCAFFFSGIEASGSVPERCLQFLSIFVEKNYCQTLQTLPGCNAR